MKQYLYVLRLVPRLHNESAWTDADRHTVEAHFQRLQAATDAGTVILAGRTSEALEASFGLVVFEATGDEEARKFMDSDPTIVDGVMTATLHPYSVALLRKTHGT